MKLNKALNFVVPVLAGDLKTATCYVHAIPLSVDAVDRWYEPLGKTFAQIFAGGMGISAGPGHAMRILRRVGRVTETLDGDDGVLALIEEIRRGMMVVTKAPNGWAAIPLDVAVERKLIDDDDKAEVESAIVFFIAVSATLDRGLRRPMLNSACVLWNAQTSLLNASEFAHSLPKSIVVESLKPGPSVDVAPQPVASPAPGHPVASAPLRVSHPS